MKIVAATGNAHKLEEIRNILTSKGITVLAPKDVGGITDVEEDGDTFQANAIIKAEAGATQCGLPVIADDSGLEVFALDGEPGIYSARYGGEGATDLDKINKVLRKLEGKDDRSARFVCVIAIATPAGVIGTVEGEVRGRILDTPTGGGGFGYDPVFQPEGSELSFGQMPSADKDGISHRGNALAALLESGLLDTASDYVEPEG
jgi:XTP/dITP diphosphohydrolase